MNVASVKVRFFFSVAANAARALLSLLTGLVVARGLSPAGYGDLTYLLGSFLAIKALLDLGSSSAFFTFLSRRAHGRIFYLMYCGWLALQFVVLVLLVTVLLPQRLIDTIWLGHSRGVVMLALVASFMQQQVWTTVTQIGESARLTVRVQSLGLAVVVVHLIVVLVLHMLERLSVEWILIAIAIEYAIAAVTASRLLSRPGSIAPLSAQSPAEILSDYWRFCRPLIVIACSAFAYEFADRWLLQRFAGPSQQGFYQIAAQLAAVSLLATTSILNIFWKEIGEANARLDKARMQYLYMRVNRGLVMLGAVASCFLIPWAQQLVELFLGPPYRESWPIFALMLLYPIHQAMGQVNAAMFMACERTREYMAVALLGQLLSIPVSFLLLAPPGQFFFHGFALGAWGLALKMVGMNMLLVNVQAWIIARFSGWKYEWRYQLAGIVGLLVLGYLAKGIATLCLPRAVDGSQVFSFVAGLSLSGLLYMAGVVTLLWLLPWTIGMQRAELRTLVAKYTPLRFAGQP